MYHDPYLPAKRRPKEDGGMVVILIFIVDLAAAGGLLGAMFASSYHYTTIAFISGASISFNVGLWRVSVSGNPRGYLGKLQPKAVTSFLANVISTQDKSLADFEAFACTLDTFFGLLLPRSCNSVIVLRVASYILASCLFFSAILLIFGGATLLIFWFNRRTLLSRRLTYFLHIIPSFISLLGLFLYLVVGGINFDMGINIMFIVADVNPVDISTGFFIAAAASSLCMSIPAFMYFLVPESLCVNSESQWSLEDAREEEALVNALHYERQMLGFRPTYPPPQPPFYPRPY